MALFRIRSFHHRIFVAILVVVLVPTGVALAGGTIVLQGIGTGLGTLGAWDAVAESGRALLDAVEQENPPSDLQGAANRHRESLSESVRFSHRYAFLADRILQLLPIVGLFTGAAVVVVALLTARRLSAGFARPIDQLVGWTERITAGEGLPPEEPTRHDVREFEVLRSALRDMAGEIEEGRRRAVESARLRSWTDLSRRVAHELKNPLTPMRMAATTLTRGRAGPAAEAGQVLLEEIERLDELARTFARYGRMPEGPRSRVDLVELVSNLAAQHTTPDAPIHVSAEPGVRQIMGHFEALERTFRNLLVNAQEAQGGRGGVRVRVEPVATGVSVHVEDRGPGIRGDLLQDIWNPDVTTKRSGTGLGLAIVQQTVHMHEGTAQAGNREGGGARFTVTLPLALEDA